MEIPLDQFKQIIDETILNRGLSYYKSGAVENFIKINNNEYEANVSGSEFYTVHLSIKNQIITTHQCDCPFESGLVCKHIVAVIFHLLKEDKQIDPEESKKSSSKNTKPVNQQVQDILNVISHQELKDFVLENAVSDKKFRNHVLVSFNHLNKDQSKEFYQKQIHSIINAATGRDGWVGWTEMKYLNKALQPFLDNAQKYLDKKHYDIVFYIAAAMLEEMTALLQYADDSNGDVGSFVDDSMSLLYKLTEKTIQHQLKKEIFQYSISAFKRGLFKGWDWHLGIIVMTINLIENEKEADVIYDCLQSTTDGYEKELAQLHQLKLIRKFKSKKEVEKFIKTNLSNPSIKAKEIEIAFENKDFEYVIELARMGIKDDQKDKPGLVKNWYNWLLKVAQQQYDEAKIIEYARFLFLDNFKPEQDYYQILKQTVDKEKWQAFLEEIIEEITPKNRWTYSGLIREIYINEQWWDRLFLMLKQNCSLENISENEKLLAPKYTNELLEMYVERLTIYVEKFIGRNHYQTACVYIKRMKKLGGEKQANQLIADFRKKYPQRKALMDELNKV